MTSRTTALSFTISRRLLKFMFTESLMLSNYLILCRPLLLLPLIFPNIRIFSSELSLHIWWPKYWRFGFSISPSKKYLVLIFFMIDRFDFLTDQGTLKSLLQYHNCKASFFSTRPSLWSNCHTHKYWKSLSFDGPLSAKWCLCLLIHCLGSS